MIDELFKKVMHLYVDRRVMIYEDNKREAMANLLDAEGIKYKYGSDPRIIELVR
jgi:hypothetical protein